jgi:hypothetical protein
MSVSHARAMRSGPQPVVVGFPEKPEPGIDGFTIWEASAAAPPCAVGLLNVAQPLGHSRFSA